MTELDKDILELTYLAGFFDGEGCVYIERSRPKKRNPYGQYTLHIFVSQKDKTPLIDFQNRFGGTIHPLKRTSSFQWHIFSSKAAVFLETMLPYLRYKKEHAEIGIEFFRKRAPIYMVGNHTLSNAEINRRESLRLRLKQLNKILPGTTNHWAKKYREKMDVDRKSPNQASFVL